MLIKMLVTRMGSEDGFVINRYVRDKFYDVADSMAADFIRKGWAKKHLLVDGCTNPAWYNLYCNDSIYPHIEEQNIIAAESYIEA